MREHQNGCLHIHLMQCSPYFIFSDRNAIRKYLQNRLIFDCKLEEGMTSVDFKLVADVGSMILDGPITNM